LQLVPFWNVTSNGTDHGISGRYMFPSFLSNRMKEDGKSSGNAELVFKTSDTRRLAIGTVPGLTRT
jgi:hypothetical protein